MTAPDEAERLARAQQGIAAVLMARRAERAKLDCFTGGYGGTGCNGEPSLCRCCDEAEDDALAILTAGYSRTAETLERAARVALNHASRKAMQSMSSDTPLTDMQLSKQAQSIAAAIRAGKGE